MGYGRADGDGGRAADPGDPYPVHVFGEKKPMPDSGLGRYLTDEFGYYLGVYENNKMFGPPYKSWVEMPQWLIELHKMFAEVESEYESWKAGEAMRGHRGKKDV